MQASTLERIPIIAVALSLVIVNLLQRIWLSPLDQSTTMLHSQFSKHIQSPTCLYFIIVEQISSSRHRHHGHYFY
jgi:hypothetical protein